LILQSQGGFCAFPANAQAEVDEVCVVGVLQEDGLAILCVDVNALSIQTSIDRALGAVTISANAISRYITFSVPTSTLGGTPGSGWGFTVVLTGQDGFSPSLICALLLRPRLPGWRTSRAPTAPSPARISVVRSHELHKQSRYSVVDCRFLGIGLTKLRRAKV
jgi:C-terminal binding-module, SLH-like, of glucodextranase